MGSDSLSCVNARSKLSRQKEVNANLTLLVKTLAEYLDLTCKLSCFTVLSRPSQAASEASSSSLLPPTLHHAQSWTQEDMNGTDHVFPAHSLEYKMPGTADRSVLRRPQSFRPSPSRKANYLGEFLHKFITKHIRTNRSWFIRETRYGCGYQ